MKVQFQLTQLQVVILEFILQSPVSKGIDVQYATILLALEGWHLFNCIIFKFVSLTSHKVRL